MSILSTRVPANLHAQTIGGVLAEILCALLDEGDCFSGKRPLGNSGWAEHLLYEPLQAAGVVSGPDSDKDADKLLKAAIREALNRPETCAPERPLAKFHTGQVVVLKASTPERGQLRLVYDAGPADVVRVHATSEGWAGGRPEIYLAEEVQAYEAPNV